MKNKIISFILVLAMCFSFICVPANASNIYNDASIYIGERENEIDEMLNDGKYAFKNTYITTKATYLRDENTKEILDVIPANTAIVNCGTINKAWYKTKFNNKIGIVGKQYCAHEYNMYHDYAITRVNTKLYYNSKCSDVAKKINSVTPILISGDTEINGKIISYPVKYKNKYYFIKAVDVCCISAKPKKVKLVKDIKKYGLKKGKAVYNCGKDGNLITICYRKNNKAVFTSINKKYVK